MSTLQIRREPLSLRFCDARYKHCNVKTVMEQAVPLEADSPAPNQVPTVLIVEDETISRKALAWLLAANGYRPMAFETAEEALHAGINGARVALLDVDLPGMSGLELADRLERIRPGLRVVLLTAVDGDRIQQFRRDHSVGYVRKPVNFPVLLSMLSSGDPN